MRKYLLYSFLIHLFLFFIISKNDFDKLKENNKLSITEIQITDSKKKTKHKNDFKSFSNKNGISICKKHYVGIGTSFVKMREDSNLPKIIVKKEGLFLEIKEIKNGSPAEKHGLMAGDLIEADINRIIKMPLGSKLSVVVYKRNQREIINIESSKICFVSNNS